MNLNPDSIFVPYLEDEQIWEKVELFRNEFVGNDIIPINIEYIIEDKLDISIIPTANIEAECGMFAFLQSDLSAIRVDEQIYLDDRYFFKYRSDLTHEIGHLYMHKDVYLDQTIVSTTEWVDFICAIPQNIYARFEYQAYEFAGRLLVPQYRLLNEIEKQEKSIIQFHILNNQITPKEMAPYLVKNLNTKFQVSSSFLEKRIVKEKVLEKYLA